MSENKTQAENEKVIRIAGSITVDELAQALGLNTYGAFYVPAVRTEYWSALPEQEIIDGGALRKGAQ